MWDADLNDELTGTMVKCYEQDKRLMSYWKTFSQIIKKQFGEVLCLMLEDGFYLFIHFFL